MEEDEESVEAVRKERYEAFIDGIDEEFDEMNNTALPPKELYDNSRNILV